MRELHRQGLIHRDLKSENIFVKKNIFFKEEKGETLVIGDFGATRKVFRRIVRSKFTGKKKFLDAPVGMNAATRKRFTDKGLDIDDGISDHLGSLVWMAPELFDGGLCDYTKASDVYAFGVVMYELVTRQVPWSVELADWNWGKVPFKSVEGVNGILPTDKPRRNHEFVWMSVMAGRRPHLPERRAPALFRDVIAQCWASKPGDRPSFDNPYEYESISNKITLAWDKILRQYAITLTVSANMFLCAAQRVTDDKTTALQAHFGQNTTTISVPVSILSHIRLLQPFSHRLFLQPNATHKEIKDSLLQFAGLETHDIDTVALFSREQERVCCSYNGLFRIAKVRNQCLSRSAIR